MSLTDEPDDGLADQPTSEAPVDESEEPVPTQSALRWPVVQALREMGRPATDAELADHVADSLDLTQQQRTQTIPSGQETRLRNRVSWAAHELKKIGAIHYPKPAHRALTPLGHEIDEEQIAAHRAEFEAEKRRYQTDETHNIDDQPREPTRANTVYVAGLVEQYESDLVYSTDEAARQAALCREWQEKLAPDQFSHLSREDLSAVIVTRHTDDMYVSPNRPIIRTIQELSRDGFTSAVANLKYLCWGRENGDESISERYTRFVDRNSPYHAANISGHGAIKLLSICHPRAILPVGSHYKSGTTDYSVGAFLSRLGLGALRGSTFGEQIVDAHKRLRRLLSDHFEDDSLRMGFFLQWLAEQQTLPIEGPHQPAGQIVGDLENLVQRFMQDSGFPTEAHKEQRRLREQLAQKLASENIVSLSREDLATFTTYAVDYGEYVAPTTDVPRWIRDLGDAQYGELLDSIRDLCWGNEEPASRIDRLVDWRGTRTDTGIKGFAQGNISATLAICKPDRFLPVWYQEGKWGRKQMLYTLGLPEPRGTTFGQQVVDANDRLRERLAPHLDDDPQAIACFLYWLGEQEADSGGDGLDGEAAELSTLIERFRAETGYPTAAHEEQKRLRAEWAKKLAPENIADFSRHDLTAVASHGVWSKAKYVYPKARGVMKWIRQIDEAGYSRLQDSIKYLCWGEDEAWVRHDQLTDSGARGVRGLGDSTVIRLLAISHPKDFLPFGSHRGVSSRLLRRLGLDEPRGSSRGQKTVDANERLIERLEPHFRNDTFEMAAFLEWLLPQKQPDDPQARPPTVEDYEPDLAELAAELLVEVGFLEDIVSLLEDKRQVILYGPPGTGKTYLARKLAATLAPDESCRALVQFHPSTSYEDFFEGYRPAGTGNDGGIRYELTPGPLARMAERASKSDKQHVMIIDEINRGNLPRVLGELLFLLEYRDEEVETLYRTGKRFSLPENLWFIGTMNTADRSIALVDAALRRRFHFVPFFPDREPMASLLGRWLERKDEPSWVGRLVDAVNNELKSAPEDSHLLLGPSHFMKEYGSSLDTQRERLRRIWEYNIEPFIEDQFFGDPERIAHFRFGAVMTRNRPPAESGVDASDSGDGSNDSKSTGGSEGEHTDMDGDAAAEPGSSQPEDEQ